MSNIHIEDSYRISKFKFKKKLAEYDNQEAQEVKKNRSFYSIYCEFIVHKFLYHIGLWRDRTGSLDADFPCDKPEWIYVILGTLLWLFTW